MSERSLPWWASPVGINIGFLLPMLMLIAWVGDSSLEGLTVRGIWFLNARYIVLAVVLLLTTSLGGWIGSQVVASKPSHREEDQDRWNLAAMIVGVVAMLAYLFFFKSYLADPHLLFATLTGRFRPDRSNLETAVGITSLENMAPVFFSIYGYRLATRAKSISLYMHLLCAALLVLTALRVYAWSERLALIEVTLPLGLAASMRLAQSPNRLPRLISRMGPVIALPALTFYFGIAEYFRSWTAALYNGRTGFWEFALGRLASYYVTSLNNGAALLGTSDWPTFKFQNTLAWLHALPGLGPEFTSYVGSYPGQYGIFLATYEDSEFTNPSGIFSVIFDLGLPLGVAYFALVGIAGGMFFRAYRSGSLVGVLFYPLLFLTFLEVFRYPYLGGQRAFTWVLGIVIALAVGRHFSSTVASRTAVAA